MIRHRAARLALIAATAFAAAQPAASQELEPKAYSASPVGAAFLVLGVARSTGGVVTDPTLPLTDVEARVNLASAGVGYTFDLFGKLALVSAGLPYGWAKVRGSVFEDAVEVSRSGLADTRIKLSVNLLGNDAMGTQQFAKTPRKTIVGVSFTAAAPTGQYYDDKLVNVGLNRWAFKPEAGIAVPKGRWDVDAYFGVWLFAPNDDYFPGGLTRAQDPLWTLQAHASYTFRPRLWVAADGTWYAGGDVRVDDGPPTGRFNNSRAGLTLSLPVGRTQSVKLAYSAGAIVRTGSDFRTFSIGWTRLWFTRP
jgi:hypothetical protein